MSFAQFEKTIGDTDCIQNTRKVYKEAADAMKRSSENEERLMILESWLTFEVNSSCIICLLCEKQNIFL